MRLVDKKQAFSNKSLNIIEASSKRIKKKKFNNDQEDRENFFKTVQNRIKTCTNVNYAVKSTDIVVGAIVENLKINLNRMIKLHVS